MTGIADFAILAPIPLEHLQTGKPIADTTGFVAFGSMKWELFRQVDDARAGLRVPVLIYPSHEHALEKMTYKVTWLGWYVGHVDSANGAHPLGMDHRPPSTGLYGSDNQGHWAVFWHVDGLQELSKHLHMQISDIGTIRGGWRKNAPPRGPELVAVPSLLINQMAG